VAKILSDAGKSLADIYDVAGSVAGIEHLETHDLPIVHEMGGTVFSERFSTLLIRSPSPAIAQNLGWNVELNALPPFPFRIYGVQVFIDTTARVLLASVAVANPVNNREMPIWNWDSATDIETRIAYDDDGGGAGTTLFLQPVAANYIPHMMAGTGQPQETPNVFFRGVSAGFGAGTVQAVLLMHIGFSEVKGLSSYGLPIPSW